MGLELGSFMLLGVLQLRLQLQKRNWPESLSVRPWGRSPPSCAPPPHRWCFFGGRWYGRSERGFRAAGLYGRMEKAATQEPLDDVSNSLLWVSVWGGAKNALRQCVEAGCSIGAHALSVSLSPSTEKPGRADLH